MQPYDMYRALIENREFEKLCSFVNNLRSVVMLNHDYKYIWERMKKRHLPYVTEFMRQSVYGHESVCRAADLENNKLAAKQLDYLVKEIAKKGVSLVAFDIQTEEMVGISLNILQKRGPLGETFFYKERNLPNILTAYGHILQIKMDVFDDKLGESLNVHDYYNVDCVLYVVYFATHPDYYRKGIGIGSLMANYALIVMLNDNGRIIPLGDDKVETSPQVQAVAGVFTSQVSRTMADLLSWDRIREYDFEQIERRVNVGRYCEWLKENNIVAACMGKRMF